MSDIYTQLTDVYQEQNGIYLFNRGQKFDMERIRKAAIEKWGRLSSPTRTTSVVYRI